MISVCIQQNRFSTLQICPWDRSACCCILIMNTKEIYFVSMFKHLQHHDDVIKWKHFPRYWPLVRGNHRSPMNSSHKGQWRGALMFSLTCTWINGWGTIGEAGDLRRHHAYYDVTVICSQIGTISPTIFHWNSNLVEIWFWGNFIAKCNTAIKLCACHNTAFVLSANF